MVKSFVGNVFGVFSSFFSNKYPRITNLTSLRNICLLFTRCRFKGASHLFFLIFFFPGIAPKFNIFFKCHNILNCKNSFFLLPYFSTPKAPSRYIYFCKPAFVFLHIYLWDFPINFLNFQEIKNKNSPLNRL